MGETGVLERSTAVRPGCVAMTDPELAGEDAPLLREASAAFAAGAIRIVRHVDASIASVVVWHGSVRRMEVPAILIVPPGIGLAWRASRLDVAIAPTALVDHADVCLLPTVLEAIVTGSSVVSASLRQRIRSLPPLDDRHVTLLQLLGRGLAGAPLQHRLGLSASTVKRELAALRQLLGLPTMAALRAFASQQGFR